jgi:hypothetical protein
MLPSPPLQAPTVRSAPLTVRIRKVR